MVFNIRLKVKMVLRSSLGVKTVCLFIYLLNMFLLSFFFDSNYLSVVLKRDMVHPGHRVLLVVSDYEAL